MENLYGARVTVVFQALNGSAGHRPFLPEAALACEDAA
jgi:hypothetical protein